ncbi:MAG TPA: hypothetical protein VN428_01185 [Bryobacteraceae bacterium]|nr:hypothetical protein [Bryobacteraceae bacterium]
MSSVQAAFWSRAVIENPVFAFDEVRRWPRQQFDDLVSVGLLRETEQAELVMCDGCYDAHWEEVIWMPSVREPSGMRAYIPCPTEMTVRVAPERLRQWAVDTDALARQIAAAMELSGEVESVLPGRLWRLGRRRLTGRFRDVFLAGGRHSDVDAVSEAAVRRLNAAHGILLTLGNRSAGAEWQMSRFTVLEAAEVVSVAGGQLIVHLDYIEDVLPREPASGRSNEIRSVAMPDGARWEDLSIVVNDASLVVRVRGHEKELSLDDAGFGDRRQCEAEQDQALETLGLFAATRGRLSPERVAGVVREKTSLKHRVSNLRRRLQFVFGIDGDPISFKKGLGEYWCNFEIRLAGHESFPTPEGSSWLDFHFTERSDGRLVVSVTEKRVFRARVGDSKAGRSSFAAAERNEMSERIYSFDELGFRTSRGQLTPEGQVFAEMLRGGGKLRRRGDDMSVLKLASWLRSWTGLADAPLQFSVGAAIWSARFGCSSEVER